MNVRLELTLFLPFLLPKDNSWRDEPIQFEAESLKVGILVLPEARAADAPKALDSLNVERIENPSAGDNTALPVTQVGSRFRLKVRVCHLKEARR